MSFARLIVVSILLGAVGMINAFPTIADGTNDNDVPDFDYNCTQPTFSDNETVWSAPEFIVKTIPNPVVPTPVFWSGRLGDSGPLLQARAEACAANKTGATIGQLMCNFNLHTHGGPEFVMPSDFSNPLWTTASQIFANHTGSNAYVVMGDAIVTSTWFNTEWPTLRNNTNVKAVIGLHPGTCAQSCYWYCPDHNTDCPGLRGCTVNPDGN